MKFKFGYLVGFSAFAISFCAAWYSITGLSQLFSGAATAVIILAGFLEFAKIISTIVLHNYWNKLTKTLKFYLSTGVVILMLITSLGIYGFLSSAYSVNKNKFEIHNSQVNILNNKKENFNKSIKSNQEIIDNKNKRITLLANLRNNQETRLDSAKSNRNKDKVRKDIVDANNEIIKLTNDIDLLSSKNNILNDSIGKYEVKILESNSNSDISREIGSLKYISDITGLPMDSVVNYLILLLIFVFDPLAIALIIATNKIFELNNDEKFIGDEDVIPDDRELNELDETDFNVFGKNKSHIKNKDFKEFAENNLKYMELKKVEPMVYNPEKPWYINMKRPKSSNISELLKSQASELVEQEENNSYESEDNEIIKDEEFVLNQDSIVFEEQLENKEIIEDIKQEQPIIEEPKPEVEKLKLEDIKEIKEIKRGFSVEIPANNKITRY